MITLAKAAYTTLEGIQGNWMNGNIEDYFIHISGSTFIEFMDDYNEPNGIFDYNYSNWEGDMSAAIGLIIDCTDTNKSSGVIYIQVLGSDAGTYNNLSYIAVAWRNKTNNSIEFATGNIANNTLSGIKSIYGNVSAFPNAGFWEYVK